MSRGTLDTASALSFSFTGLSPSMVGISIPVLLTIKLPYAVRTPTCTHVGLGSSAFARRYLRNRFSFSSSAYLDVSVQRVPSEYLWIQYAVTEVRSAGFPHSEIRGSPDICSSPRLIAACHVFLRRSVPRHPPCALCHLTFWFSHSLSEVSPAAVRVASQPAAIIS